MALSHATYLRNQMADMVVDAIDAGSSAGVLEIYDDDYSTKLATLTFSDPAFGDASSGSATANTIEDDEDAGNSGTAARFIIKDSDGNEVLRGSVSAVDGGGDIELSRVTISAGDTVSVTSLTYQAAS